MYMQDNDIVQYIKEKEVFSNLKRAKEFGG